MMRNKMIVAALLALPFAAAFPANQVNVLAALPCESNAVPVPGDAPPPPTGLRLLSTMVSQLSQPVLAQGAHPYFEILASRSDCLVAYGMRSQAQLDSILTLAKGGEKKLPVTYDATMDAAVFRMFAAVTLDTQQKVIELPLADSSRSVLLTWDFKFDEHFKWVAKGYARGHKAWRLDTVDREAWMALKTDYQRATNRGTGIGEVIMTVPSKAMLAPGATRGEREIPQPKLDTFFMEANTWTRVWWLIEDLDKPVCHVSVWMSDERRDAVQLFGGLPLYTTPGGLRPGLFRFEYDTSSEQALNPGEMRSWNRNFVAIANPVPSVISGLLQKPTR
jgi:hypothetical protein